MHGAECGKWIENGDFFGHDIPAAGTLAVSRDACMTLCQDTAGCNAVTFKKFTQKCWLKELPEGETYIADWESDTIVLCGDPLQPGTPLIAPHTFPLNSKALVSISLAAHVVCHMQSDLPEHTSASGIAEEQSFFCFEMDGRLLRDMSRSKSYLHHAALWGLPEACITWGLPEQQFACRIYIPHTFASNSHALLSLNNPQPLMSQRCRVFTQCAFAACAEGVYCQSRMYQPRQ